MISNAEIVLLNNIGWGCDDLRRATDVKPIIISRGQICDGVVDCPNGRDEHCTEDTNGIYYIRKQAVDTSHIPYDCTN